MSFRILASDEDHPEHGEMSKRVPIDCKRIKENHLRGLSHDQLMEIAERIAIQNQALNRARRLVDRAARDIEQGARL